MEKLTEDVIIFTKEQNEIIKAFTNSQIIARNIGVERSQIEDLILKYEYILKEFGTHDIQKDIIKYKPFFGIVLEEKVDTAYTLNQTQSLFLLNIMNKNDIIVNFEHKLINGFEKFESRRFIYPFLMIGAFFLCFSPLYVLGMMVGLCSLIKIIQITSIYFLLICPMIYTIGKLFNKIKTKRNLLEVLEIIKKEND